MDEFFTLVHGIGAWLFGLLVVIFPGFGEIAEPVYYGYVEANYVYVAATNPGRLETILTEEGESVAIGQILFTLDDDQYQAALSAAVAQEAAAEASWRNLETGSRQEETDVIRASLKQAQANQALAEANLQRDLKLHKAGVIPDSRVDAAQAQAEASDAAVAQLEAQLAVAELPARSEQLAAAEASHEAAAANVQSAHVQLDERTVESPIAGTVDRIYYTTGEVVGVGSPVLSILAPDVVKVEFFISEPDRNQFRIGDMLRVECDGCQEELSATLTYLASEPQYTPPIIYSRDERGRMVFMAEARLDGENQLLPGQPVTMSKAQ